MNKRALAIVTTVILLTLFWLQAAAAGEDKIFSQVEEIISELSEITGFEARRSVPYAMISRDELKEFLETRIDEEIKPEEIRIEEILLKKFGFLPEDFDLKQTMIDLYTEQAAAFYDFDKRRLFLLDSEDDSMQEVALVHELAHALADQHFRLEKFINKKSISDDSAMARMAVMEGQATWLMSEYTVRKTGQSMKTSPKMAELMSRMIGTSEGQFPVFDNAPLYLRESLMFPYTSGILFQQAAVERLGEQGFSEVFRNPPETTQEILHPETYFKRREAEPPKLPEMKKKRAYKTLAEGTLGEFDYAILLRQFIGDDAVRRISPQWRAASYRLLEHKKDKHTVLLHVAMWSNPETAAGFFESYQRVLQAKWKTPKFLSEGATKVTGTGDDGNFLLLQDGSYVYVVEGMESLGEVEAIPVRQSK